MIRLPNRFSMVVRGESLEHHHVSQVGVVATTLATLLVGQEVDEEVLVPYPIKVGIGPAAILLAAADYLDDGLHDQLVQDLRTIAQSGDLEDWP